MDELIQLAKSSIMALFPDDRNRAVDSLRVRLQDKSVANGGAVSLSMIFSKVAIAEGHEEICKTALSHVTDQASLLDIAEHANLWSTRLLAAERLCDMDLAQLVYDEIAREADDSSVRARAASRLNDQQALTEVAQNDDCLEVRLEAAIRLTNETLRQRVIAEVGANAHNRVTVVKALEYLTDQAKLAHILLNNQDSSIRLANVGRLTDQNALAQIIRESNNPAICTRAIERLNDQAILAEVVLSDIDYNSRRTAFGRITDQNAFARIIRESNDPIFSRTAIEQLNDQALLATVALSDVDLNSRRGAVDKLADQIQLTRVVREANEFTVFSRALARMNDHQDVLVDIARNHLQWKYRREAVWRINRRGILVYIARNDSHLMVRQAAAEKTQDKAIMHEVYACVAQQTDSDRAGIEALKNLTDQAAIYSIAQHAVRQKVRLMAVSMLNDTRFLANVAQHNRCEETAMTAFRGLVSRPDIIQADIKRIALVGQQDAVRKAAVSKLQDIAALVQIAKGSAFGGAHEEAVVQLYSRSGLRIIMGNGLGNQDWNGLTQWISINPVFNEIDRDCLTDFLKNAAGRLRGPRLAIELCLMLLVIHPRVHEKTKSLIINNTTNSDVLSLIVEHAQEPNVCRTALGKITNPQALIGIAGGDSPWRNRYQATLGINDVSKKQDLLEWLAKNALSESQCLTAVKDISDPARLAMVAKISQFHDAVQAILDRIASDSDQELSQSLLFECAQDATKPKTRIAAVERMTDESLLRQIADNQQQSFFVRIKAAGKLQDKALVKRLEEEEAEAARSSSAEERTRFVDGETLKKIQVKECPPQKSYHYWTSTFQ